MLGDIVDPNVVFFDKATMNVTKSKEAKRRIYDTVLMVTRRNPGITDYAAEIAQPADIKANPAEYQYYLHNREGVGSPGTSIIPGINTSEIQELFDYGLDTINKLCAANTLPAHLEHLKASALRINKVLQEESSHDRQENPIEETRPESPEAGRVNGHGTGLEQQGMLAADRRHDPGPVEQQRVSGGEGNDSSKDSQGIQADRRVDYRKGLTPNWTLSIG